MIYTVTLNPAIDYVISVDQFKTGRINRNQTEHVFFGGKGINVSCILRQLGTDSTALGFIAGFTGKALNDNLTEQGIHTDFVWVKEGMTRINVKMKSDDETEINGKGPQIEPSDFEMLKQKLQKLTKGDILILSGSIPSCMREDTYEIILNHLSDGVEVIVDAEKNLLLKTLHFHPFLIKPNHIELGEIFRKELQDDAEIVTYARKLQERGARNVLVSMGGKGAILVDERNGVHTQPAAKGTVVNSVGAGDSMVAGFLSGYLSTQDYAYALKLGTACGGATAFHSGLGTRTEIEQIFNQL